MTLRRKLDSAHTKSVSCSNSTSDEPQYVGVSQQQDINEDTRSEMSRSLLNYVGPTLPGMNVTRPS